MNMTCPKEPISCQILFQFYFSACPVYIGIDLIQANVAERPEDDVILQCVISGVQIRNIKYFWWMDVDDDLPVYSLWVSFNYHIWFWCE